MNILNLTQHSASAEQQEAGVIDLPVERKEELIKLLTFGEIPSANELAEAQVAIARLASNFLQEKGLTEPTPDQEDRFAVMIGGAPFLMGGLEAALKCTGLRPVYAFSRRESVEAVQEDGSVRKVAVFRHLGFVGL
jgi:hypothetical protein